ncbi:MAG TPA: dTDP-4-dehydrorhamnose 3,5-epimerase [Herpetosiphonaceae bacterium]
MQIVPTNLEEVLLVKPEVRGDERGFFLETYHQAKFAAQGIAVAFVQDNHSRSKCGVLRGLHYQAGDAPMAKLVRCTFGSILDVAVDLRLGSPTFGRWAGATLTDENKHQLFVPAGFGHGFLVLSDYAEVQYKCSSLYAPEAEGAVLWNDPEIGIEWTLDEPILSARDQQAMTLEQYRANPAFVYQPA